jgi:hypothetical protein
MSDTRLSSKERNPLAVNLEILGSLVRFAYANGYHELGYDVLTETVAQLRPDAVLFNKGIGVLKGNRFSFSFENAEEADRAFHYIATFGTLQTSQPPKHPETPADTRPCGTCAGRGYLVQGCSPVKAEAVREASCRAAGCMTVVGVPHDVVVHVPPCPSASPQKTSPEPCCNQVAGNGDHEAHCPNYPRES